MEFPRQIVANCVWYTLNGVIVASQRKFIPQSFQATVLDTVKRTLEW